MTAPRPAPYSLDDLVAMKSACGAHRQVLVDVARLEATFLAWLDDRADLERRLRLLRCTLNAVAGRQP